MGNVEDDAMKLTKLALALMEEDAWKMSTILVSASW